MSVSKWNYSPEKCDGKPCPGDCDFCSLETEKRPIVHMFYVKYATDIEGAAKIAENALMHGSNDVRTQWDDKAKVYSIQYKIPRED